MEGANADVEERKISGPSGIKICRHWQRLGGYCAYGDKCQFLHPIDMRLASTEIDGSGSQSEIVRALWLKNYKEADAAGKEHQYEHVHRDEAKPILSQAEWDQRAEMAKIRKAEKTARKAQIKAGLPVIPSPHALGLLIEEGTDEALRSILQNAAASTSDISGLELSIGKRKKNWHNKPKRRNQARGACFARWMIDTFGHDSLNTGTGVVDVAGGKGGLSFELFTLLGIQTTLVEPRTMEMDRRMIGRLRGRMKQCLTTSIADSDQTNDDRKLLLRPQELSDLPPHLESLKQNLFSIAVDREKQRADGGITDCNEEDQCESFTQEEQPSSNVEKYELLNHLLKNALSDVQVMTELNTVLPKQLAMLFPGVPALQENNNKGTKNFYIWKVNDKTDTASDSATGIKPSNEKQLQETMQNASLVVGMHSDQATEPIVDAAIAHGKRFAVVPCCVFNRTFHWRRLKSGCEVKTYDDFVQYLLEKEVPEDQEIVFERLDFTGRNSVVYSRLKKTDGKNEVR